MPRRPPSNGQAGDAEGSRLPALDALHIRPTDRVLVLGGYGLRNVGDEAILSGLLNELPDCRLRVISRAPEQTCGMHHIKAISPVRALGAVWGSNVLIVGGGGIFSGHMGSLSKLIPLFSRLALARGVRVSFHGIGVYPSAPRWVLRSIVALAPRLASITVRDAASARVLRSFGVEAPVVPDLSQGMPPASSERGRELLRMLGLKPSHAQVALCLTATEPSLGDALLLSFPSVIDALPEVQFAFVPMSHHPTVSRQNDLWFARRLQFRAPQLAILEDWLHPAEILALLGQFSVVVGMRYHSVLFAERAGAAIIAIPYAEKCVSWIEEQGLESVGMDAASLTEHIRRALCGSPIGATGGRSR
jgi:polysaccharide pyruvyl transferase WcaK-like protein